MNNGFSETVDRVLRRYGLKTRDCVGTMWSDGNRNWRSLKSLGYRIEKGINNPDYDYVIISKENSTLENILKALTITKVGCIIIFRADMLATFDLWNMLPNYHICGYDNGILGVIFKGKEV